ncbi:GSCFA family protein [Thiothrix eikelboomii]|uniref:GSCFA family protein n=1 Tax=Thiothrix eikelboomii TaxID=92487 RepID=A0A1T4Y1X8_9GAMM|nr:GSCFA domain-containing protein [Thiothrix eikelboomii]SKA95804.1 GSCFA family protein [Thiothrix eikelboomii]
MKTDNPYTSLPDNAFWKTAVAGRKPREITGLWTPKFEIKKDQVIATAGSCFAQHIGRALKARGYAWHDSEPAPLLMHFNQEKCHLFNYGVFTFRTGNIYTVALLKQWLDWSLGKSVLPDEIWQSPDKRYYDLFRPNIEPNGFKSAEEALKSRQSTLKAMKSSLAKTDLFIFTLGLTEAWVNRQAHSVYPICPGTLAGEFDPTQHQFKNFNFLEIYTALTEVLDTLKSINPHMRFLLTVSPVPLTATASGEHVVTATLHSKSILRAVAGELKASRADTDYFPSYEIISAFPFKGVFYAENMRNVQPQGVNFVMNSFFNCQARVFGEPIANPTTVNHQATTHSGSQKMTDEVCEDALLDAFKK